MSWLKERDSNTPFFHRSTMVRRARNLIVEIKTKTGQQITGRESISNSILDYFKYRWTVESIDGWEGDLSCIPQVIFDSINLELCRPISEEEIEGVVKAMPREKASGPDGIPAKFYINC